MIVNFSQQPDGGIRVDSWPKTALFTASFLQEANHHLLTVQHGYVNFSLANGAAEYKIVQDLGGICRVELVRRWATIR